jgi:hypothetical protein
LPPISSPTPSYFMAPPLHPPQGIPIH